MSQAEQEKRFNERLTNPLKRWKFSDIDLVSRQKWHDYSLAKDDMFDHTDTQENPWYVIESDDKYAARLNCIRHLINLIPYEVIKPPTVTLLPVDDERQVSRDSKKGQIVEAFY